MRLKCCPECSCEYARLFLIDENMYTFIKGLASQLGRNVLSNHPDLYRLRLLLDSLGPLVVLVILGLELHIDLGRLVVSWILPSRIL